MKRIVLLSLFTWFIGATYAQKDTLKVVEINLEIRPRFEFRNGYRQLPSDSLKPAYFISQRSRLNLTYKRKKVGVHLAIQDVSVWGQYGASPAIASIGLFQGYGTYQFNQNLGIKIGRQAIEWDNGRLITAANWNQFSRAHDGISLNYLSNKTSSDLIFSYNQGGVTNFGTAYNLNTYKYLFGHHFTHKITPKITLTTVNLLDGYQSLFSDNTIYVRGTSGGGIDYTHEKWAAKLVAYYQYGQLNNGQKISAYYIQPQVSYKTQKFEARLGMELFSGDNVNNATEISNSFSSLYGVAFKLNGHLNYFTDIPNDTRNLGLINPYLFLNYKFTKKLRIKLETHLFYTQQNLLAINSTPINTFLGAELDLKVKYRIEKDLSLDFGLSTLFATESISLFKTGDYTKTPLFSFLMLTWKPQLIKTVKKR